MLWVQCQLNDLNALTISLISCKYITYGLQADHHYKRLGRNLPAPIVGLWDKRASEGSVHISNRLPTCFTTLLFLDKIFNSLMAFGNASFRDFLFMIKFNRSVTLLEVSLQRVRSFKDFLFAFLDVNFGFPGFPEQKPPFLPFSWNGPVSKSH